MKKSGFIAIAGRPNAGKSTLLNAVLGSKISIVTPKAQTTRERVLGILTEKQGQIVMIDTPGIHQAKEGGVNEFMMDEAQAALEDQNLVWYIVDPSSNLKRESLVLDLIKKTRSPVFLLMNKQDIVKKLIHMGAAESLEKGIVDLAKEKGIEIRKVFRITARAPLAKSGIEELLKDSWELIPEGPFHYPDEEVLSDRPTRFFVSEMIREQLFLKLGDEVPYACAVKIENFDEKATPIRIEAEIHVERDSQKGMVIGAGGQKIKEIGQSARMEIEKFLGQQIFLGLRVRVSKDWSSDSDLLKKLGYVS